MPRPIKRRELIRRLRALGWGGPEPGGAHEVMFKGRQRLTVPNPHRGDIDWSLTNRILELAKTDLEEWENL